MAERIQPARPGKGERVRVRGHNGCGHHFEHVGTVHGYEHRGAPEIWVRTDDGRLHPCRLAWVTVEVVDA